MFDKVTKEEFIRDGTNLKVFRHKDCIEEILFLLRFFCVLLIFCRHHLSIIISITNINRSRRREYKVEIVIRIAEKPLLDQLSCFLRSRRLLLRHRLMNRRKKTTSSPSVVATTAENGFSSTNEFIQNDLSQFNVNEY